MPSIELSQSAYDELKKHFIDKQYKANIKNPFLGEMFNIFDEFELRISALETSKNRVYKFDKLVYHPHDPQEKCTDICPQ